MKNEAKRRDESDFMQLLDAVHCMDWFNGVSLLPDKCIDAVITDPPYGTTQNKWDKMPDLELWWREINRVCKGAIVMTAAQPFTSHAVISNLKYFKWADVWRKSQARGHLNSKVMPLRQHEDILVFCNGRVTYNPQFTQKPNADIRPLTDRTKGTGNYGEHGLKATREKPLDVSYPRSVIDFENSQEYDHPTQKPLPLFQYLIASYTNKSAIVLDPFMGSGTTAKAAQELGRHYIGFEINEEYIEICRRRTAQATLGI